MLRLLPLGLLLLGACGSRDVVDEDKGVTANQIERLSTPENEVADQAAPLLLEPLKRIDLAGEEPIGAGCAFGRDGKMMLAASGGDAIARINGRVFHFLHSSPVNATGGFFEDRQLSISVGRSAEAAGAEAPPGSAGIWPARLTLTNRRTGVQSELDGVWRCGG